MEKGYIYVLINPSMKGMVKIGKTNRNPEDRAKELSAGTNIPFQFQVGYDILVSDIDLAEKKVHKKLEKFRVANNREFFEISLREAVDVINKVVKDEKINLNIGENWDYTFQDKKYSDFKELVITFTESKNSLDKALFHIKEGYIEKWLENIRNYDLLQVIKKLKEQHNKDHDLILVTLLFSIHKDIPFRLFNFDIHTKTITSILKNYSNVLSTTENDIYELFRNGKLNSYYKIYKKYRNYKNNNLDQIFDLQIKGYRDHEILKILDWYQNPNNYYLNFKESTLNNQDILKIPTKDEIQDLINKFYLPNKILSKLKSKNISDIYEVRKILRGKCTFNGREYEDGIDFRLLKKFLSYQISHKIINSASSWSIDYHLQISSEILDTEKYKELTEPLIIPPRLLLGIMSDNIEVYKFCLILIRKGSEKNFNLSQDHYNIQEIEKHLFDYKSIDNKQIQEILNEFHKYKKLYDENLKFIVKHRERLQDHFNYNGLFPLWKHGYLSEKDEGLYKKDPFINIVREPTPYFIQKENIRYALSIINQFVTPKTFDVSLFKNNDLNKFYWFINNSNNDKLVETSRIEDLVIPRELKKIIQKVVIEHDEYLSLSDIFPKITDKESLKELLIPNFINEVFQIEDIDSFSKKIAKFKILKDQYLFLFKKNITELCRTFFLPENFENELRKTDSSNYEFIVNYLKKAGVLMFFSYNEIAHVYSKREKEYNEYKKKKKSLADKQFYYPNLSICYNNHRISASVWGIVVNHDRDDEYTKNLYKKLSHLNWYNYVSDLGHPCATLKTRYILQNLDSWLLINEPITDKKLLIEKEDTSRYKEKWGLNELKLLLKTFNKAINYHILVQFLMRNINISKLIELNRDIDIIKDMIPEKYYYIVERLEDYFYKLSDYNYDPLQDSNTVYREFITLDFKFITSITYIIDKRHKLINRIFKNQIANKLLKTIEYYRNKIDGL
jgi:hypothetical protein